MDLSRTLPRSFRGIMPGSLDPDNPAYVVGLRYRTGSVFFVSSVTGAAANTGRSWDDPLPTLVSAVAAAIAGDTIIVGEGHVETITGAAGLALSKAGMKFYGMGNGNRCPQINFTTAVGASMTITGAGTLMCNFRFTGGIDALTGPVSLGAADITLLDIVTEDVTGQATDFIVTDDNCDRFTISGWQHRGAAAAGADTAISIVGGDDWLIEKFALYGNFAVAAIENVTTAANRARIRGGAGGSSIWTEHANDIAITMVATTTGNIEGTINIMLQDNAANITECIVAAAMQLFLPINVCNLAGEVAMTINITASTDA